MLATAYAERKRRYFFLFLSGSVSAWRLALAMIEEGSLGESWSVVVAETEGERWERLTSVAASPSSTVPNTAGI